MGLTEDRIQQALLDYENEKFSPRERAALRYAEVLTADQRKADAAFYEDLSRHFTDAELVELGVFIGVCNGFDKLISTWDLAPEGVCQLPAE